MLEDRRQIQSASEFQGPQCQRSSCLLTIKKARQRLLGLVSFHVLFFFRKEFGTPGKGCSLFTASIFQATAIIVQARKNEFMNRLILSWRLSKASNEAIHQRNKIVECLPQEKYCSHRKNTYCFKIQCPLQLTPNQRQYIAKETTARKIPSPVYCSQITKQVNYCNVPYMKISPGFKFWKNMKHMPMLQAVIKWKRWPMTHLPNLRSNCGPASKRVRLQIITEAIQMNSPLSTMAKHISLPEATAALLAGCFTASLLLSYLLSCPWCATDCQK